MNKILLSLLASLSFSLLAHGVAQASPAAPVNGTDYATLSKPQATDSTGKVEVTEFFWYGCPHCNALEPALEAWVKKLPGDVVFKRIPVAFRDDFVPHQRLYYTLEAMGKLEELHAKVFHAIHVDKNNLINLDQQAEFAEKNGLDKKKFIETYNSFSVQSKVQRARQLTANYAVDGVPMMAVDGRFTTSASMTGNNDNLLIVTDNLVKLARGNGKAK
ncbi:thiol:disulfide interchange protein DsbA/DsbL [Ampullimonas aquatilis]|uniref:thiol:disulfide interchange protein DsbA/DsbL n=1 Tax=Ampullimonas aquatilis TaxID=1341549 RepID=UPI003C78BBAA